MDSHNTNNKQMNMNINNDQENTKSNNNSNSNSNNNNNKLKTISNLFLFLLLILTIHFTISFIKPFQNFRSNSCAHPTSSLPTSITALTGATPSIIDDCMNKTIPRNGELVYFPRVNILFLTMAKSGTSTLFHWLYGLSSNRAWNNNRCDTYVQNVRSPCWRQFGVQFLYQLPESEQRRVINGGHDGEILRVAIQRNPYERLISSFKSKYTCETERFDTDVGSRAHMVNVLKSRAGLSNRLVLEQEGCMNISEFSYSLAKCQQRYNNDLLTIRSFLDVHIRPQLYCFHEINADMVIDVKHLSDAQVMKPVFERFQNVYKHQNKQPVPKQRHISTWMNLSKEELEKQLALEKQRVILEKQDDLVIPAMAASRLFSFAKLSQPGPLKFQPNAYPEEEDAEFIKYF